MEANSQVSIPDRSSQTRVQLPGFGLPLEHLPKWTRDASTSERFPHAIADFFAGGGVSLRERRMLDFINKISDKPGWERKVFDEEIVLKWRTEGVAHSEVLGDLILSEKMFDFCIAELRQKADIYTKTGLIAVYDFEATVVKSDTAISGELREALIKQAYALEDIPEQQKDWHPGSDEKVLDLLHPSLFPLVYGVSRVLPYGAVPLHGCTVFTGMGEVTSIPDEQAKAFDREHSWGNSENLKAWGSFQWLPSNITFDQNGKAEIVSYINNLHPETHRELYKILEQFVDCSIPLWNETLSWFHERIRIPIESSGNEDYYLPEGLKYSRPQNNDGETDEDATEDNDKDENENENESDDDDLEWDEDFIEWRDSNRILIQPEPEDFSKFLNSPKEPEKGAFQIDLRERFAASGLQVIFKLANIHLTPDKPTYDGGSWHVEGALNEHICATALYYYSQENVTESHLAFRQSVDTEAMTMKPPQNEYQSLEEYYGIQNEEAAIQELGEVVTREDRLLAFPNVLQHSVRPFELADPSKPGHRKLLAMFLVDPHVRVISTGNVPPQNRAWWAEEVRKVKPFKMLAPEIFEKIIEEVEEFPISWESALEFRGKLMDERGAMTDELGEVMARDTFYFCEH